MHELLWQPQDERIKKSNMTRFIRYVNRYFGTSISSYNQLYDWSINEIPFFWKALYQFGKIKASQPYEEVVTNFDQMLDAKWFTGCKMNFAENLLRYHDDRTALIFKSEAAPPVRISYKELNQQVARTAKAMRQMGVTTGDRVAGLMPNMIETVVAMLAATSIGAIWSSCSPDFGVQGVLDRFGQIEPKLLFTVNGYFYNGKAHDCLGKVAAILEKLKTVERVVVVPYTEEKPDISNTPSAVLYQEFLVKDKRPRMKFTQLPFDHPVYIMYSSGTTGVPKCIVHGAGGTLIQHLKEQMLHTDLKREDTIFYFTTCSWMMWNWLVSSLAVGATALLFEGSPFFPDAGVLWQLAQDEGITIFGTSPKYLTSVEKAGLKPGAVYNLSQLKTILSTGSPLSEDNFRFVYNDIKQDICLSSISGGTDIISCFALGNPIGPVFSGELQCRGLGMKIESWDYRGKPVINQKGELVCTAPFPSMPVHFWNDPAKEKYQKAYFDVYPNIWWHGDYVEITDTGGLIIYGRSDATLNPGGVRIGTAEIYRQVETLPEVIDSLAVGQRWEDDVRVILFVKLALNVELTEELVQKIKTGIRSNTTPRHVPAKIIPVKDIPYTFSGKKVELAVHKVIHNEPVLNKEALANPEALEFFRDIQELQN